MPLTSDELAVVRSWVGAEVTDAELNARYLRLGTITATVEEQLRYDLAVLMAQPARVTLPSGLSVSTADNIKAHQERLNDFLVNGDLDGVDTSGGGIGKLYRQDKR